MIKLSSQDLIRICMCRKAKLMSGASYLLSEFTNVRAATVDMFSSFNDEVRQRSGIASGVEMSVEALGYIISGHLMHHMNVIQERYTQ